MHAVALSDVRKYTHTHTRAFADFSYTNTHECTTMSTDNSLVKEPDAPFPLVVATNEVTQWLNMDRL